MCNDESGGTMMDTSETTRLRAPMERDAALIVAAADITALLDRMERAERERDDALATLETRNAEHAHAMERIAELEARLTAARKATDDLPRHLGATWWGQQLRAALAEPTAEVSR